MGMLEIEDDLNSSKIRLFNWLWDEVRLFKDEMREIVCEKGQKLPLNI